ncbi:MAG TPA: alpha/beta hydrolase, partial [Pirellulales bacterium]
PAERRAVMLYFHGSKDRLDDSAVRLQRTAQRYNVTIMGFDYRGHGRSEGRPSESAVLDDARAARSYLAKRTGVSEQAIVLLGSGFGTGIAVDLAAYDGCRGLILENAYTSLRDAADSQAPGWMKPSRFMDTRMSSIYKITFYHGPLLQCHGDANTVVPFEQGRQLFKTANDPKKFVTIRNGKHDDPLSEEFKAAIDEFIQFLPHEPPATAASRASLSTAVNSSPAGPATTEKLLTK